jgi:membrane protein DedA with SNARE-associated domain
MDVGFVNATELIVAIAHKHQKWLPAIVFALAFFKSLILTTILIPFFIIFVGIFTLLGTAGTLHFWSVLFAAAIGTALGDSLSYWLGRHYRSQIAALWPLRNVPGLLPRGEAFFERWGGWAVVIGRFIGPIRATIPTAAGAAHMPNRTFQIANWSSAFLWAAVLLTVGGNLGQLAHRALATFGRG